MVGAVGSLEHGVPKLAARRYFATALRGEVDREMHEGSVPAADEHVGLPRHGRMHRVLRQLRAIHIVLRVRGNGANQVTRVDVFEVHLDATFLEEAIDLVLQKEPDVPELLVAAGV